MIFLVHCNLYINVLVFDRDRLMMITYFTQDHYIVAQRFSHRFFAYAGYINNSHYYSCSSGGGAAILSGRLGGPYM